MLAQTINTGSIIDTSAYTDIYNKALPNEDSYQKQTVYRNKNNKTINALITEIGNKIISNNNNNNNNNNSNNNNNNNNNNNGCLKRRKDKIEDSNNKHDHNNCSSNDINSYFPVENNTPIAEEKTPNFKSNLDLQKMEVKKIANSNNPFHIEGHEESSLEKQYNEMVLNKVNLMKDDAIDYINPDKSNIHPSIQRVHVFTTNEVNSNSRPSSAQSSHSIGHVTEMINEHICPECQEQLLKIYSHCLDKKEYIYPPINCCDENKLGNFITKPPYFECYDKKTNSFTQAELRMWEKEEKEQHNKNKDNSSSLNISINIPGSLAMNNNEEQSNFNENIKRNPSISNNINGNENQNQSAQSKINKKDGGKNKRLNVDETINIVSNDILKEVIKEGKALKNQNQLYTLDLHKCPFYNDSIHKIIREKRQLQDDNEKMEREGGYRNGIIGELGLSAYKNGGVFSGALAKSYISLKQKENKMIKDQYYELKKGYKEEIITSSALETALRKSMKYYIFAEEWQELQSERLKDYIRFLKIELSSLLAFLINSEAKLSNVKIKKKIKIK